MANGDISKRVSELYQRIQDLRTKSLGNPDKALEVLSDTFEELEISLEELSALEKGLSQRNESSIEANKALQENEAILHGFFDSPGAMRGIVEVIADDDVRHIADNKITAGFLGLTTEMMWGKLGSELGEPQEILRIWVSHYRQSQSTGKPVSFEYQDKRGGHEAWLSVIVSYLGTTPEGKPRFSYIVIDITDRKRAEEALRESQALLSAITDDTSDLVFVKDRQSRIIFANTASIQMIGKPRKAVMGKCDREFYDDPKIGEAIMANDRRIMESGQTEVIEEVGQTPDGYRTYLSTKTPYRSDSGEIIGIIGIARDITERKKAEEALRESEARRKVAEAVEVERKRLFDVLETLPAMVCLLTADYHVAFANHSFREKFGESHGRYCYECCFGLDKPCEFCESYNVLKTGQPHNWEVTGPDGSVIEAHDFPFTDVDGSRMILEMDIDITEHRRTEAALHASNAYNRSLIEASLDPLVTIGPNGKITDVNAETEAVTGYSREELIGTDFSDYFTEPDKARAGYQQVFKEGFVRDYALEIRHHSGHVTPVLYNASVYMNDAGEVIGVFAAARDVSAQKQAAQYARSLIESSLDPLVTIDADGKITDVNEATIKVTGIPRDQLIGTDFSNYFTEPEKAREGYQKVFAEGFVTDYPLTIRRKDGRLTDVLYNASIYKDIDGNVLGVFAAARDITERRQAEIELDKYRKHLEELVRDRTNELETANTNLQAEIIERKKAEEAVQTTLQRFYTVLSSMYASILLVTDEGRSEFANQAFCDFFGLSCTPADLLGLTSSEVIGKIKDAYLHPDEGVTRIKEIVDLGQPVKGEEIAMQGDRTCLRDFIPINIDGKSYGRLWHHIDITERKRVEEALRVREHDLARAQTAAHLGSWRWDLVNDVVTWSNELYRIFGVDPKTFIPSNASAHQIIHPDDRDLHAKLVTTALTGKAVEPFESRIIRPSGEERIVLASGFEVEFDILVPFHEKLTLFSISLIFLSSAFYSSK